MFVVVIGGGKVGFYLGKTLLEHGHEVVVVERNRQRCTHLEDSLGLPVVWGDGSDLDALEAAGARRADVLVAVTGADEDNLVACQMARRQFGCRRVVARVNNPRNEDLFRTLGIEATVSSTRIIFTLIEEEVEFAELVPVLALRRGNLQIVEVHIAERSRAQGMAVRELALPRDCILLGVLRDDRVEVPRGDTQLQAGDQVLALVRRGQEAAIMEALNGGH